MVLILVWKRACGRKACYCEIPLCIVSLWVWLRFGYCTLSS